MIRPLLICCLLVIVCSCQRELEEPKEEVRVTPPPVVNRTCRITASQYFGSSGSSQDAAVFTYANGQQTKLDARDKYIIYRYSNNLPVELRYFQKPSGKLFRVDSAVYNTGKITRLFSYTFDPAGQNDSTITEYAFNYTADRLQNVTRYTSYLNASWRDTTVTTFDYNGLGNAVRAIMQSAIRSDTIRYEYDSGPNYFQKLSPFFLTDPLFRLQNGFEPHMPYFFSKNNVVRYIMYGGTVDLPVKYMVDTANNPVLVRLGNVDAIKYQWTCQ